MRWLFLFLLLLQSGPVWARGIAFDFAGGIKAERMGNELVLRNAAGQEVGRHPLTKVEAGSHFYHWSSPKRIEELTSSGGLSAHDVFYHSQVMEDMAKQLYGVGFYMSSDRIDSASYGEKSLTGKAQEGFWVLQDSIGARTTEEARAAIRELSKLGIRGAKVTGTWFTFFDGTAVNGFAPVKQSDLAADALKLLALEVSPANSKPIRLALKVVARLDHPSPELIAAAEKFLGSQNISIAKVAEELVPVMKANAQKACDARFGALPAASGKSL